MIGCDAPSPAEPPTIRKIILISLDTLRADHLGTYGYARDTTPNLDEFARQSFVFDRTLAPAPNTPPSQMSMMTSLYPGQHGFTGNADKLAPGIETLADRLGAAGLQTAAFVDGGYLNAVFGFNRGFATYDDHGGGFARILPKAERWLNAHDHEAFFLFLHSYDIHAPYVSPAPYQGMFHEHPYTGHLVPSVDEMDRLFMSQAKVSAVDMQHLVDSYDEGIRYVDAQIGRFFKVLEKRGRLEDTLVIVTSDHGEEFGEHGSVIHWQLYFQPNLRIPLIIRPPGGVKGPLRISDQAELIDVLPTLLSMARADPLAAARGRSLESSMKAPADRDALAAQRDERERAAFAWWPDPHQLPLRSVILDDRQLIFNELAEGRDELYDLDEDPMAQQNLAVDQPGLVARMRALGLQGMRENAPTTTADPRATDLRLDPEVHDQLRALGYFK